MLLAMALVGVMAGIVTTTAGMGGGMLLVAVLALVRDPLSALVLSSLALFIGNAQRLYLFRDGIEVRFALPVLWGVVPGVVLGAALATRAPPLLLQIVIVVVSLAALARTRLKRDLRLPRRMVAAAATGVGLLSATSGGGGFLLGPILLATGARGALYLSTGALVSVMLHGIRITSYAMGGLIDANSLLWASGLAGAIVVGNLLGHALRLRLAQHQLDFLEDHTPVACAIVALAGL